MMQAAAEAKDLQCDREEDAAEDTSYQMRKVISLSGVVMPH